MARKKKKNNQPAKKREKGKLLTIGEHMQDFKEKQEKCKELFLDKLNDNDNGFENKINNFFKNKAEKYKLNYGKNKRVEAMYAKIFMPRDTKQNLPEKIENLNLRINKYPYFELKNKNKFNAIYYDKYCVNFNSSRYYQNLEKLPLKKEQFELEVLDKLIIGLGSASVYETSITLHHIYGVPYIPASAIKGSFRSFIINKYYKNELEEYTNNDKLKDSEKDAKFEKEVLYKKKWFVDIFGDQEQQGKVYFFDAFAVNAVLNIEKDIMNPHYPKYYSGEEYPTDMQNPTPINFLTVKGKFRFVFGVKKDFSLPIESKEHKILEFIKKELKNSLKEFGIGAKTAVGYGYFKD